MSVAPNSTTPYSAVIHSLTSLRFVAAAWVVVFHFKEFFKGTALDTSPFANYGFLGVDFFFVLSGFVLAHVYLPKLRGGGGGEDGSIIGTSSFAAWDGSTRCMC